MSISGSFSLGFSNGFDYYSGVAPVVSDVLSKPLISQYWLNDFNKKQETYTTWNK